MKTRIMTAVILLPVLLALLLFAPTWILSVIVGVLAAVASYEMLYNTKLLRHTRLNIYSAVMAFCISLWSYFQWNYGIAMMAILVYYLLVFGEMMFSDLKLKIQDAFLCFLSGVVVPFMITSLVRIDCMDQGRIYIWIPFVVAFMSDSGAYFAGMLFGKHKLCPAISPKKTVEGLIGGVITGTICMLLYGLIVNLFFDGDTHYLLLTIFGIVGSLASAFGDLCLSVIKRQTGIKDYGNLFPGHGGVLDRLDSVMVAAPLTEGLLLLLLPLVN